ncbi:HAD family hydrolase [Mucilaginibacter gossypii]|uniref:HAD family hydrolase n=1 Tax=Mucilaginibacter gossypii TaxID=551996 RepID=UPI000DCDF4D4|nr:MULTISPECIES: HAD family hydrolase [Mucilaginibacter]QTE38471.1 HAD family hydrolase [Mucilaginibacter gossypii]RAV59686.1 HAD family hydrolase [Mucilaginibacter rubeus]
MKKAIILDLDNTIYPVSSIADHLFNELFNFLDQHIAGEGIEHINKAKEDLKRIPYQKVADKYQFSELVKNKGLELLNNIEYNRPMQPFDDYKQIREAEVTKFLVTTGFTKLQWSKVKMLNIEADFEAIHIVDPELSPLTKKDIFASILEKYDYKTRDVLIIGDDPESEIKAASDLGIDTFLYDPENKYPNARVTYRSQNLKDAAAIVA